MRLGDELAVVVGVLAVLGWLVWARFVVAVVAEVRTQLDERRRSVRPPAAPVACAPTARARTAPAGSPSASSRRSSCWCPSAPASRRAPRRPRAAVAPRVATAPVVASTARPRAGARPAAVGAHVTVAAGDTLIGIARTELGDGGRWREIFDANRDTCSPTAAG